MTGRSFDRSKGVLSRGTLQQPGLAGAFSYGQIYMTQMPECRSDSCLARAKLVAARLDFAYCVLASSSKGVVSLHAGFSILAGSTELTQNSNKM
eukprot:scaffold222073_cov20-Tisochrysis_lutea.AAC.2